MKNSSRKNRNANSQASVQSSQNSSGQVSQDSELIRTEAEQAQAAKLKASEARARMKAKNSKNAGKSGNARGTAAPVSSNDGQAGQTVAAEDLPVRYQVKTRRDSDMLKAYITFTYRVFHPGVTGRLLFIGILIALPAIIAKQTWLRSTLLIVGGLLILLGLFRQYISLAMTKSRDADYKSGIEFTYEFTDNDASFYRGDELVSYISKYKEIINFYHDEGYYYLGIKNRDFFILPKNRFTVGEAAEFEGFIYKKCRKTCRWIPNNFKDRLAQRRASRAVGRR